MVSTEGWLTAAGVRHLWARAAPGLCSRRPSETPIVIFLFFGSRGIYYSPYLGNPIRRKAALGGVFPNQSLIRRDINAVNLRKAPTV
jgi:hypothetical protein